MAQGRQASSMLSTGLEKLLNQTFAKNPLDTGPLGGSTGAAGGPLPKRTNHRSSINIKRSLNPPEAPSFRPRKVSVPNMLPSRKKHTEETGQELIFAPNNEQRQSSYSGQRGSVLSRFKKAGGGGGGLLDIQRHAAVLEKNHNIVSCAQLKESLLLDQESTSIQLHQDSTRELVEASEPQQIEPSPGFQATDVQSELRAKEAKISHRLSLILNDSGKDLRLDVKLAKDVQDMRKETVFFVEGKFNQITQPRNPDANQKSAVHVNFGAKKKPMSDLLLKKEIKDLELKFDKMLGRRHGGAGSSLGASKPGLGSLSAQASSSALAQGRSRRASSLALMSSPP